MHKCFPHPGHLFGDGVVIIEMGRGVLSRREGGWGGSGGGGRLSVTTNISERLMTHWRPLIGVCLCL